MKPPVIELTTAAPRALPHLLLAALTLLTTPLVFADDAHESPQPETSKSEPTEATPSTLTEPEEETRAQWLTPPNYGLPALEIFTQQLSLNLGARAAGQDFAMITPQSMWTNLTGPWWLDEDSLVVNQIGHPYQGAMYFSAARSNGLGFWPSAGYTLIGSLAWEYLWETEPPSINDQITTTIGGILTGEALHRLSRAAWQRRNQGWGRSRTVAAWLLDPMGMFNRRVLHIPPEPLDLPPSFGIMQAGLGAFGTVDVAEGAQRGNNQFQISGEVMHGLPGTQGFNPDAPMDHFKVELQLAISRTDVLASMYTRGLMAGRGFDWGAGHGIWGMFVSQDFLTVGEVRAGAFGTGVGVSAEFPVGDAAFLQATGLITAVPIGAAGKRVGEELRDYNMGPGSSQLLELRLGRVSKGALTLSSRTLEIFGLPLNGLSHIVVVNSLSGHRRVWQHHALGFKAEVSVARIEDLAAEDLSYETDSTAQVLLTYSLLTDRSFGSARGRRLRMTPL